jgi:hypothetical protein
MAGLVVAGTPVSPGVVGRDVECARWSEAEDVRMGDAPAEEYGPAPKAASSALADADTGGCEEVEVIASS